MHVPVQDEHPLRASRRLKPPRSHRDVVYETEPHGPIRGRVMPWWTCSDESRSKSSVRHGLYGGDQCPGRADRRPPRSGGNDGVGIQPNQGGLPLGPLGGLADALQMGRRMHTQQVLFRRLARLDLDHLVVEREEVLPYGGSKGPQTALMFRMPPARIVKRRRRVEEESYRGRISHRRRPRRALARPRCAPGSSGPCRPSSAARSGRHRRHSWPTWS